MAAALCAAPAALCAAPAARGLTADQLLLVVNAQEPAGAELAAHYARVRGVPPAQVLALELPTADEISFEDYEKDVVPPIRAFLKQKGLERKVTCLVSFYGVPLKIAAHAETPAEKAEREGMERELQQTVTPALEAGVAEAERLARQLDPAFQPAQGKGMEALGKRADAALNRISTALRTMTDEAKRRQVIQELAAVVSVLGGRVGVWDHFGHNPPLPGAAGEAKRQWEEKRAAVENARRQAESLGGRRFDPAERLRTRLLYRDNFGMFMYGRLLEGQIDYLKPNDTAAALDNELALLWWGYYPRPRWQVNVLNYEMDGKRPAGAPPQMMVARLDGPDAQTVRAMIDTSVRVEREGLRGQVVLDSRGLPEGGEGGKRDGYGIYDESIRRAARLVRDKAKLPLVWDDKPAVFGPGTVNDVAVYCGWYSVGNYVPSFTFAAGAVGYHIASWEMTSLHSENKGWVRGLLKDGVVATLGPVSEPYLQAFPMPDDYVALLLTGKLTMAEVYWKTTPMTSWMIGAVGDPLYTPFKAGPALKIEDLPDRLRGIFSPATQATTQSAP